jgi:hypothetical protein
MRILHNLQHILKHNIVKQTITSPTLCCFLFTQNSQSDGKLASLLHCMKDELLFGRQFVPYCTTKYIFILGKNRFD